MTADAVMAQFSAIEVLAAMAMTRRLFRIVPCLAGVNTSAIYSVSILAK